MTSRNERGFSPWALAAGTFLLGLGSASAQVLPDPMDLGRDYEIFAFEAADTDGNNLISEAEFARDAAAAFAGLDRNRDGKLSPQELGLKELTPFNRIDANGDGALTFTEVMEFKIKAFRAADKNRDGAFSFDEIVNAVREEVGR
jgi:Ca2+-binding EF-hand superfamily protein